jgi:hypothetical protein
MEKQLTFEEIDAHINAANLADFEAGGQKQFTALDVNTDPGGVLQKICGIYKVIKPILAAIVLLPIPAPWKKAIKIFKDLMDALCP